MNNIPRLFSCFFGFITLLVFSMPVVAQPPVGPYAVGLQHSKSSLFMSIEALAGGSDASSGDEDINAELQETFGTKALNGLVDALNDLHAEGQTFLTNFAALTDTSAWLDKQTANARSQAYWDAIANDLLSVVGVAFLAALLLEIVLFPLRRNLRRRKPADFFGRLAIGLGLLGLRFLTVFLFIGLSLTLLEQNQEHKVVRFVVLNVVYALAVCRLVVMASRFLFSPRVAALRLFPATAAQAVYAHRLLCVFSVVIAFGYFCVDVARAVHIPATAITAFGDLLGFVLVTMTMVVIMQKRVFVSARLRGDLPVSSRDLSLWQSLRLWFARRWHVLATMYLVVGYLIAVFGVENGFAVMLRGTILTLFIFVLMRLFFHAVNRWSANDEADGFHHAVLRFLSRLVIWVAAAIAAAAGWGIDIAALFTTPFGQRVMGAGFSIGVTIVAVTLIYEIFSAGVDRYLNRRDITGGVLQASARTRTLLSMVRNTAFIVFTTFVGLVVLSAAGVNIAPFLAGAGVVGVAIGFGSQTLVKDFITGLFIVLENTIAVGDLVKIGDCSGIVEAISIRTIRLRDENGALHIMPFSEVTKITNMMRDFSYVLVDVGVAYDSDLGHVMDVIRAAGEDLQKNPVCGRLILEPVEVLGVENLGDSSITIRSRIRTRPGKQGDVRRMFLLHIKQHFDREGVEIPFPTVTHIKKEEKQSGA